MKQHNTHQGKPGESHKTAPANPKNPNKDRKPTHPIDSKEDVQQSNDEHIDQDFPGYPHHPSKEKVISNGSANAFDHEDKFVDEDSDEDNDDLVLNRTQK